jgi:DNA-binding NarL/FixJ family response regulator
MPPNPTLQRATPAPPDDAPCPPPRGILVVDDHDLVRLGVRALVQSQTGANAPAVEVFEADTLASALALYAQARDTVGLVLLDLALPDTQGLSGLADFHARFPLARIVVLSGSDDSAMAEGALTAGALAFLPKSADLREVVSFIRACGLLDVEEAAHALPGIASTRDRLQGARIAASEPLSPRQLQVLQWVLEGKANKEIAQLAHLSEGTVKNHVSTLLLLFGLRSRAQLISQLR